MALGSSLNRARVHRSVQTVVVNLNGSGVATDATTDVTLSTAVTSPRYVVTRQTPNTGPRVTAFTLTSTTNLRITWSRDSTVTGNTEQWLVEEFF